MPSWHNLLFLFVWGLSNQVGWGGGGGGGGGCCGEWGESWRTLENPPRFVNLFNENHMNFISFDRLV